MQISDGSIDIEKDIFVDYQAGQITMLHGLNKKKRIRINYLDLIEKTVLFTYGHDLIAKAKTKDKDDLSTFSL